MMLSLHAGGKTDAPGTDESCAAAPVGIVQDLGHFALDSHCCRHGGRCQRRYAAPIKIPTPSTMTPPSTIWNTACRNGVSMYFARMKAIAHSSKNTTTQAIPVAIQNAFGQESGTI